MRVRYIRTLDYYDLPQVFEARDAIGGHYIAVLGAPEGGPRYLVAGVAPGRLRVFCNGECDLRSLVEESIATARYTTAAIPSVRGEELEVVPFSGTDLEEFLPEPGYVLDDLPSADLEAGDDLRLELRLDVPGYDRIDTGLFTDLIQQMQTLAKHALADIESITNWRRRDSVFDVVVPAESGSFRVVLEASSNQVQAFHKDLGKALKQIDKLFRHSADPRRTLEVARELRGDVAGGYVEILRRLTRGETGLRYSWTGGGVSEIRGEGVSSEQARVLLRTLDGARLEAKSLTFDGELYKCNAGTGHWVLRSGSSELRGYSRRPNGPDLGGLRIRDWYRFHCVSFEGFERRRSENVRLLRYEPLPTPPRDESPAGHSEDPPRG